MAQKKDFNVTQHFDGDHAGKYDEKIKEINPGYNEIHALSLYLFKDNLPENSKILVSGVGTGHEAVLYAENQKTWEIVGVDPTPEMIKISRNKIASLGLADRVKLIEGEVESLNENNFDGAASILVMQFIKDNGDKKKYLQNICKKLKKGGKFILVDLEGERNSESFNLLLSAWKKHQYCIRDDKEQIDKDFEHVVSDIQFITEKRTLELMNQTGFIKIHKFYKSYLFSGYIAEKA